MAIAGYSFLAYSNCGRFGRKEILQLFLALLRRVDYSEFII
jgi:hypothetical protein